MGSLMGLSLARRRQPNIPLRVNRSHPLVQGALVDGWDFASGLRSPIRLAKGAGVLNASDYSPYFNTISNGVRMVNNAVVSGGQHGATPIITYLPLTVVMVFAMPATTVQVEFFTGTAGSWDGTYVSTDSANINATVTRSSDFSGSVAIPRSIVAANQNVTAVYSASLEPRLSLAVNGVLGPPDTAFNAPASTFSYINVGADGSSANSFSGSIAFVLVIGKRTHDAGLVSLSLNPWQLFD